MRQETLAEDSWNNSLPSHGLHVVGATLIANAPDGFDDRAFLQFKKALLARVHCDGMRQVVIDVSSVLFLDSATLALLESTAKMLSLLGARVVFSGFQPGVVAALIELDADFDCFTTVLGLADAMELFANTTSGPEPNPEETIGDEANLQADQPARTEDKDVC
jgi:Anti-anti-sigma regulatory factor (antagonist of anti-sigma factor)